MSLAIAWAALPHPMSLLRPAAPRSFPFRAALRNRDAVILMIAYGATIWGAVGLRQWIVLFLGFCAGDPTQSDWSMLAVASLISLLGVPAGLLGVELAIRCGLRLAATLIFLAAAVVTGLFGFAAMLPFGIAAIAALAASFVAQGTFSNLTSGLLAVVMPRYAGVTMAFYSCIGFGGGFLGNVLFGRRLTVSAARPSSTPGLSALRPAALLSLLAPARRHFYPGTLNVLRPPDRRRQAERVVRSDLPGAAGHWSMAGMRIAGRPGTREADCARHAGRRCPFARIRFRRPRWNVKGAIGG